MENQVRSAELKSPWLVSPAFDLLTVANLYWPIALIPWLSLGPAAPLSLWQVYLVTTPHRWLTLLLVVSDPDRRAGQSNLLIAIAILLAIAALGTAWFTGGLGCLILFDIVWNAWHFGSQHAGVLAIYSRKVGGGPAWLHKHGLRWFIVYVALRLVMVNNLGASGESGWNVWASNFDLGMFALPVLILLTNQARSTSQWIYLGSVCLLYSSLLLSLRGDSSWTVRLALASALFHATEYLAIVTHYARRRQHMGSTGLFRQLTRYWLLTLSLFMLSLGIIGYVLPPNWIDVWLAVNLFVAYLHYAYDGLIWKLRRPETAQVLGANQ